MRGGLGMLSGFPPVVESLDRPAAQLVVVMRPASVSGLKRLYRHSRRWDNAIELPYKMCVMRENFSDAD